MKKRKCKQYLKLVMLLFGVTFVLSSCQKDDDFTRSSQAENSLSPKFKISKINKKRIEDNELIIKKLNRLNESINKGKIISRNRTTYSDEFDFYVDTNYATYTESLDGNYHSYTFPIIPLIESDTLQNLVLTLQPDNSYETLLVTYALTAQEKENIEKGNIVNLNNKITFNKIENDSFVTEFLSKEGCTYTIEEYCSSTDHDDSTGYDNCGVDFYSIVITETCTPSGGGGAGSWGDSGEPEGNDTGSTNTGDTSGSQTNNGGSGGSSSNGGVTTPTTPCRGDDCPEELDIDDLIHKKNCEELQELLDIEPGSVPAPYKTLKEAIADSKNNLDGASEEGYEIRHNSNLEPLFVKVNSNNTGEGYCNYSKVPSVYGGLHLHLDNTHPNLDSDYEPMFSHKDIKDLLEFTEIYSNPSSLLNSSLFVHLIVTYQGTYAIKIKDLTKLQHLNSIWSDKKKKKRFMTLLDREYRRKTDNFSNPNGTAEDYQKIILKHINIKYDLGISLFKTTEYNGEPVGWEELILVNGDTANSIVVKKPCNE